MRKLTLFLLATLILFPLTAAALTPNSETTCENGICTAKIYSFQKNYPEDGVYKPIDENFDTANCEEGFEYCVDKNIYQFNAEDTLGNFRTSFGDTIVSMNLESLSSSDHNLGSATIDENTIQYPLADGMYLKYTYLPSKIKEELILEDRLAISNSDADLNVLFSLNSEDSFNDNSDSVSIGDLVIKDFVAYDSAYDFISLPFKFLPNNQLSLSIPFEWLASTYRVFPLYIDPTIETNTSINSDRGVIHNWGDDSNSRVSLSFFSIGLGTASGRNQTGRASINFNISSIPTNAQIQYLNLTLVHRDIIPMNASYNKNITITHMDGNSTDWPNNATGNQAYWDDMGNGTVYATKYNFNPGYNKRTIYFNLSNGAYEDFESRLTAGTTFSIGIRSLGDDTVPQPNDEAQMWAFHSSTGSPASERPVLEVTYFVNGSNETAGDAAIETGILNSLPNATIHDEQQVYIRLNNGTQQIGRFDKFVQYGNQRWGINYITEGESYTYMNNVSDVFYVLELEDMFVEDIEDAVEAFINSTKW